MGRIHYLGLAPVLLAAACYESNPDYAGTDDTGDLCRVGNVLDDETRRRMAEHIHWPSAGCRDDHTKQAPVGSFAPNELGLYDMSGNVWEWVYDAHAPYLAGPAKDPVGPEPWIGKGVVRGGSWFQRVNHLEAWHRRAIAPSDRSMDGGFRVARSEL